jgi:hypothetical protein
LEEAIDLDLKSEIYDDDGDDSYEDVEDEVPDYHTNPVKKGKEGKAGNGVKTGKEGKSKQAEKAKNGEKVELGRKSVNKRPDEDDKQKEDDDSSSSSSSSDDSGDSDNVPQGIGANNAAPSAPDEKGKVEVPKEGHNTVVIGLKVYTNKDVDCFVEGRLRVGCKDPSCTLCEPPVIVSIPAAEEGEADEAGAGTNGV